MRTHIISLGGSTIVPDKIDTVFLKNFRRLIMALVRKGHCFVIVTGGGRINREYNKAAKAIAKVSNFDLDWIGIAATRMNAEFIRSIFSEWAYEKVVNNPNQRINTNKKIIIGSGYIPGSSSDKDAVILADNFGAKEVINLFDKDYVYDKDPDKFKDAKPLKNINWSDYLNIIGTKWLPRLSTPFDPIASRLAETSRIKVIILKGKNLRNLKAYLTGKKFKGTVISNDI